jgi:hypothetical protein
MLASRELQYEESYYASWQGLTSMLTQRRSLQVSVFCEATEPACFKYSHGCAIISTVSGLSIVQDDFRRWAHGTVHNLLRHGYVVIDTEVDPKVLIQIVLCHSSRETQVRTFQRIPEQSQTSTMILLQQNIYFHITVLQIPFRGHQDATFGVCWEREWIGFSSSLAQLLVVVCYWSIQS